MKNKMIIIIPAVVIAVVVLFIGFNTQVEATPIDFTSYEAPDFTVTTTNGETLSLSDIDKPVMVYFTATWCPFCKKDLEEMEKVYGQYEDEIEFVAVDMDLRESAETFDRYQKQNGFPGIFATGNEQILSDYDVFSTTTKYGIKDGVVVFKSIGPVKSETWNEILASLVN